MEVEIFCCLPKYDLELVNNFLKIHLVPEQTDDYPEMSRFKVPNYFYDNSFRDTQTSELYPYFECDSLL